MADISVVLFVASVLALIIYVGVPTVSKILAMRNANASSLVRRAKELEAAGWQVDLHQDRKWYLAHIPRKHVGSHQQASS